MTNKEIVEKVAKESGVVVFGAFCKELTDMLDLARADEGNYKAKYEKAIKIIRKFDAGIIGMYDL